jgi:D-alanine-D-alanine ligase
MGKMSLVIGLTYDLREEQIVQPDSPPDFCGEFDSLENIDHLDRAISSLGYIVRRIGNATKLVKFLADGGRVDLVFNMAEGQQGRSREGQVPAILEAFGIPYTGSDALAASMCLDKGYAKRLWQQEGLPTARFAVIHELCECDAAADSIGAFPLFVKPLQDGSSKGIDSRSIIETLAQLREQAAWLLKTYRQPVLVETYLTGREYTVGVLGGGQTARTLGMAEVCSTSPGGVSSFADKEEWEQRSHSYYSRVACPALAAELGDLAVRAYRSLGCQDIGRVDIRCDDTGQPHLLEINPVPAMHPTHSAMTTIGRFAGISYAELLGVVIDHARRRWAI